MRAGDMERAQLIAVDIVTENPDDANGWYLLSHLVDSDARRAAYLSKTLALDPAHARARLEFDSLPPALVQDLGPAAVALPTAEALSPAVEEVAEAPTGAWQQTAEPAAEVPGWLQPLSTPPAAQPDAATPRPPVAPAPSRPRPQPAAARKPAAKKKNGNNQALSILLGLLALLTLLVLVFLVYLLVF